MNDDGAVIVGAGAAGLMAAIWAGRKNAEQKSDRRIVLLDGEKRIGAKILVAGGGRCNVTNAHVSERDFAGSTPPAIRNVLRRFDVPRTIAFFEQIGVQLKIEPLGKMFPTTDRAATVLDALLGEARRVGVEITHPRRVKWIRTDDANPQQRFEIGGDWGSIHSARLIIATGGRSLPKTGSDGAGYNIVRRLGVEVSQRTFPALVPLLLESAHPLTSLQGIDVPKVTLRLRRFTGKVEREITGAILCTHFGLSGPAILDMSRHLIALQESDPHPTLEINWLYDQSADAFERLLLNGAARSPYAVLLGTLPDRLLRLILDLTDCQNVPACAQLSRDRRKALVKALTAMPLPITGDRGFKFAEVTAGGVPLSDLHLKTLEARACPGLHLCGEICDVDGRIGGFNFQWAWASGFVAGTSV